MVKKITPPTNKVNQHSARGFACIGLDRPKTPENIGGVLRAAYCYGAAQVTISQCRAKSLRHRTNTPMAHRHTPVFITDDVLSYVPFDTQIVAVDLVDGAVDLPGFVHPERAMYVFGAEDGTLGESVLARADHRVMIPMRGCMNLAASVNVVLYDRMCKGRHFSEAYEAAKSGLYDKETSHDQR